MQSLAPLAFFKTKSSILNENKTGDKFQKEFLALALFIFSQLPLFQAWSFDFTTAYAVTQSGYEVRKIQIIGGEFLVQFKPEIEPQNLPMVFEKYQKAMQVKGIGFRLIGSLPGSNVVLIQLNEQRDSRVSELLSKDIAVLERLEAYEQVVKVDPNVLLEYGGEDSESSGVEPDSPVTTRIDGEMLREKIPVAVIDSGFRKKTENKFQKEVVNSDLARDFSLGNEQPATLDSIGTGTKIMSILAGVGTFKNRDFNAAEYIPLSFVSRDNNPTLYKALRALAYARQIQAKVILWTWTTSYPSKIFESVLNSYLGPNTLLVTSAGVGLLGQGRPHELDPIYPAMFSIPQKIVVGAVKEKSGRLVQSNYSLQFVDIAAQSTFRVWEVNLEGTVINSHPSYAAAAAVANIVEYWARSPSSTALEVKSAFLNNAQKSSLATGWTRSASLVNLNSAWTKLKPELNPEDPLSWNRKEFIAESEHGFHESSDRATYSQKITLPGAQHLAIEFDYIWHVSSPVGPTQDRIDLLDRDNKLVARYYGIFKGLVSVPIPGDTVTVEVHVRNPDMGSTQNLKGFRLRALYFR